MSIDVLLAVYNGQKYIGEQIDSIFNQTEPPTHLFIRDNASEDNTHSIVLDKQKKYPNQIIWISSKTNVGIVGNFSALVDLSCGNYVMFSDSDDVWLPQKIEKTLLKMIEMENRYGKNTPILIHTDLKVVNERLEVIHPSFGGYSYLKLEKGSTFAEQLIQNKVTGCTIMVNRRLIDMAKPIPQGIVMHDWWLALVATAFGKVACLEESLILYRQHGKNDTGAKKYGLISNLKRGITRCRGGTTEQAKQFFERYSLNLSNQQKETLTAFKEFQASNPIRKLYLMYTYGFYKVGILRNIWQIFF